MLGTGHLTSIIIEGNRDSQNKAQEYFEGFIGIVHPTLTVN